MTAKADSFFLVPDDSVLVVIDVQEKLTPAMPTQVYQQMRSATEMLVKAAALFGIPVLTTEQYPRGLGHTVPELSAACAAGVIEKTSFGCCGEPNFVAALKQTGRQTVVVTGMETHVCVYQTVLGLLSAGYRVHLVRDAICSRNEVDYQPVWLTQPAPVLWLSALKWSFSNGWEMRGMNASAQPLPWSKPAAEPGAIQKKRGGQSAAPFLSTSTYLSGISANSSSRQSARGSSPLQGRFHHLEVLIIGRKALQSLLSTPKGSLGASQIDLVRLLGGLDQDGDDILLDLDVAPIDEYVADRRSLLVSELTDTQGGQQRGMTGKDPELTNTAGSRHLVYLLRQHLPVGGHQFELELFRHLSILRFRLRVQLSGCPGWTLSRSFD